MLSNFTPIQKGIIAGLSGFIAFALADACSKWLGMRYETLQIIFWIYSISFVFGLLTSPFLGGLKKTLQTKKLHIHLGRGICALAIALFVVSALKGLSLAMLYTVLFTAPFLTTIAALPLFKEKVPRKNWFIIALGFSGILIAFRPGFTDISIEIIYAIAALCFIVILGLLARPLHQGESLHSLSFYPSLVTITVLGAFLFPNIALPEVQDIPVFLIAGVGVTIGLSGIAYGYSIAPFSIIAPIHYIQMVMALTIGYIVFGDVPDLWMIAGASVIIVSGVMLIFSKDH